MLRFAELALRRRGLLVVNYHRVSDLDGHLFDDATVSATPEAFRRQIDYLRREFTMPPVDHVLDRLVQRCAFREPTALITFDDGYRDNYERAAPILRAAGVPAVFFVPTSFIERPRLPWWDRAAYVLKRTTARRIELDYPARIAIDLDTTPLAIATRRVLRLFKDHGEVDESRFFDALERGAHVEVDSEALGARAFMTWAQLGSLLADGMRVGSHTHTHRVLAHLPADSQRTELARSKAVLEEAVGSRVEMLAYPVGGRAAFTAETCRLAHETGYRAAFSFYGGFNAAGSDQPFDVKRMEVELDDDLTMVRARALSFRATGRAF